MPKKDFNELLHLIDEYESNIRFGHVQYFSEEDYLQIIDFYLEENHQDKALEAARHGTATYPYSTIFYYREADLLIKSHQEEKAISVLNYAITLAPAAPRGYLLKAEAYAYLDRYDEAMDVLEQLSEAHPDAAVQADIFLVEALIYENQEQYELMFIALQAALREVPNHQEALERLALCVELTRNYEASVTIHEKILEQEPYCYFAWYNLGQAHAYLGNYQEAIEAYEYAIVSNESFEPAYRDCAELCFELNAMHKSLRWYQEILERFEPDAELFLKIGQIYQQLENYNQARTYLTRAMHLDHMNDEVHFHIGVCFAREKKWASAIRSYEKAIQIEDLREEYFAALGEALFEKGDIEEGIEMFDKATSLAPEEPAYWILFATNLLAVGQPEAAVEVMEDAIYCSTGTELLYCRATCLFACGQRNEAIYQLGEALTEDFELHSVMFTWLPALKDDATVLSLLASFAT
ncbi:MAG: tetratricopeptide repeat protein [Saprospiraceae bacterium]|jgi:tetratricopeptide (TPR) repeat protein|nr:tetratricopeptide repeat protein [Saprospiraceae bacterium]MDP4820553.1 tetratricopeptide repeat protein [Saprospiraceae bacterium]MDP4997333.1 tetratricopeptide repeat protein [Saprospiraceae bacterium]